MSDSKLEIACFNLQSALIAQQGGADRIELCADMKAGGTTPNYGTLETARKMISVQLFVMIRPRGGNFVYSDEEFELMANDIKHFKTLGVDGFVFGILNSAGSINKHQNKQLVELANPSPCTFHRAFDACGNMEKALEDVIDCGFKTILTSGCLTSAANGLTQLNDLMKYSRGRIEIMPGGGIRSSNIAFIASSVKTSYYHSSAINDNDLADIEEVKLLKEKIFETGGG